VLWPGRTNGRLEVVGRESYRFSGRTVDLFEGTVFHRLPTSDEVFVGRVSMSNYGDPF